MKEREERDGKGKERKKIENKNDEKRYRDFFDNGRSDV